MTIIIYILYMALSIYIGNNFDHIFEFDHNFISDSSLIMYLSLPILSVLECHNILMHIIHYYCIEKDDSSN